MPNPITKNTVRILYIAIAAFAIFLILQFPILLDRTSQTWDVETSVIEEPVKLNFAIKQLPLDYEVEINFIEIDLGILSIPMSLAKASDEICVNAIEVHNLIEGRQKILVIRKCIPYTPGVVERGILIDRNFQVATTNSELFGFPFVKFRQLYNFQVAYSLINDNVESEQFTRDITSYTINMEQGIWRGDIRSYQSENSPDKENISNIVPPDSTEVLDIEISGHPYYKYFTVIMTVGIVLLIILTLTIKDTGSFVEATAALLFGIFGVRQLIIPKEISIVTILDSIFLIFYFLIAFTAIIHSVKTIIPPQKEGKASFYATKSSNKYHSITCKYINLGSKTEYSIYENEEAAKVDGRIPCKYCLGHLRKSSSR